MNETPARFGSYEVLKRLAMGGMGEIYLARQTGIHGFERLAIVKTLLDDLRENEEQVAMFLSEARIAALLNHPGIVQIYEVGEEQGTFYIAMEFVEGDTMSALVSAANKMGKHSPWPFVSFMAQAARALHHAHNTKDPNGNPLHLVHRDISPQNIMVRRDGMTKVVDFGIAKVAQGGGMRTATGVIKGKLAYMAPEQVRGTALDGRTDLYSLGVVLWEMTTGRRMFPNMPEVDIFRNVLESTYPRPSDVVPGFNPALEAVVMKALKPAPEDRYQSGNQMADALEAVLAAIPEAEKPAIPEFVESLIGERVAERVKTERVQRGQQDPAAIQEMQTQVTDTGKSRASNPNARTPSRTGLSGQRSGSSSGIPSQRTPSRVSMPVRVPTNSGMSSQPGEENVNIATMTGAVHEHITGRIDQQKKGAPLWLVGVGGAALTVIAAAGGAYLATRPSAPPPAPVVTPAPAADPKPAEPSGLVVDVPKPAQQQPPPSTEPVKQEETPPPPEPVKQEPAHAVKPSQPRQEKPRPVEKPKETPPPAQPVAGDGFLTLQSNPWADVTIDGQPVGTTPLFKMKLTAGTHRIVLKNAAQGLEKTETITIRPGVEERKKIELK